MNKYNDYYTVFFVDIFVIYIIEYQINFVSYWVIEGNFLLLRLLGYFGVWIIFRVIGRYLCNLGCEYTRENLDIFIIKLKLLS